MVACVKCLIKKEYVPYCIYRWPFCLNSHLCTVSIVNSIDNNMIIIYIYWVGYVYSVHIVAEVLLTKSFI